MVAYADKVKKLLNYLRKESYLVIFGDRYYNFIIQICIFLIVGDEMLYVPMFKGRQYEHQVMIDTNQCFSENMIPLIEILQDHYRLTDFATDAETGEFLKIKKGKRMQRYRVEPTEEERVTLQYYSDHVAAKKAFIDLFRFSTDVYGRRIKASAVELSQKLNQNENLYIERLLEVRHYKNLIPVLSIKNGYFPQTYQITDLIKRLQSCNSQIAVRLDDAAFEAFLSVVAPVLRNEDFVMYDIGEQNVASKGFEIDEFNGTKTLGRKIILNSPRKRAIQNGDYENRQYTDLIDNSVRDINVTFPNIYGFGDYCALKDVLPNNVIITRGSALALFYNYSKNQFMVYVNANSAESFHGYFHLIPQILQDAYVLDPTNDCPAIEGVRMLAKQNKSGIWGNWIILNMIRYITQMYKSM